jgi:hypothetical protein
VRELVERLRRLIREAHPGVVERAYPGWGSIRYMTSGRSADRVVYLSPGRDHVNLGFPYSRAPPDPHSRLTGVGENMRHARVTVGEPFEEAYYRILRDAAFSRFLARGVGKEEGPTRQPVAAFGLIRFCHRWSECRQARCSPGQAERMRAWPAGRWRGETNTKQTRRALRKQYQRRFDGHSFLSMARKLGHAGCCNLRHPRQSPCS